MPSSPNLVGRTRYLLKAVDGDYARTVKVYTTRDVAEREALRLNAERDRIRIANTQPTIPRGTTFAGSAGPAESPRPRDGGPFYFVEVETEQKRRTRIKNEIDAIRRSRG